MWHIYKFWSNDYLCHVGFVVSPLVIFSWHSNSQGVKTKGPHSQSVYSNQTEPIPWINVKKIIQWAFIKITNTVGTSFAGCLWPILLMTLISAWRLICALFNVPCLCTPYLPNCGIKILWNTDWGTWFGLQEMRWAYCLKVGSLWCSRFIGTILVAWVVTDTRGRNYVLEKFIIDSYIEVA